MESVVLQQLRDPELVAVRKGHFERLWQLSRGMLSDRVFVLNGIGPSTADVERPRSGFLEESLIQLATHVEAAKDPHVFRPLTITYDPRGVHFIDYIFDAEVFLLDGSWQAHLLDTPIGELPVPDVDANDTVQAARALAQELVSLDLPGVLLGMPTLSSALNVAVNLYGQGILLAMMIEPQAAKRDLRVIHEVISTCHRWYLKHVPAEIRQCIVPNGRCQPPDSGQLCGCTSQLLSPELYAEFIAPLDAKLLGMYPNGGMIHLCGKHTQHIPVWREMASLRAVQLNDTAAADLEHYFKGLREDQMLYVNPCPEMPLNRILEITGGERLVLVADVVPPPASRRRGE